LGSDELESLRRAESQRQVLLCLLENESPMSSQEVAERLGVTVNAANIALHQLHKKGLVERVSRGVYRFKLGPILSTLLKRFFEEGR